jgi:hypothetical protein
VCVVLAVLLAGCPAVRGRRGEAPQSGFLGDYSKLAPREGFPASEIWVDDAAPWSSYSAVVLDSVTLWVNEEKDRLDPKEGQMLTDLLYKSLHEELSKQFVIADRAGTHVLRLRAALTQAKGSNVAMRTASTVIPQALLLGTVVGLSADTARTVGTATAEVEMLDSLTGRRLAAAVDQRAGTKDLLSGRTFQKWGDVEAASQYWAKRAALFLVQRGVQRKPGAPEPG